MAKFTPVEYPVGPIGPSADVTRPAGKWEADLNYDPASRPGYATVVPAPGQTSAPTGGAGTDALHPLTILLRAAGALNDRISRLATPAPATLAYRFPYSVPIPGPSADVDRPPSPAPGMFTPPGPLGMAAPDAPAAPASPPAPAPTLSGALPTGLSPADPPSMRGQPDMLDRFLRAALDVNPATADQTDEQKDRAITIFRNFADKAWRENTLAGTAVSNIESGYSTGPAALARTRPSTQFASPIERERVRRAFEGDPGDPFNVPEAMRATPEAARLRRLYGDSLWNEMPPDMQRRVLDQYIKNRAAYEANRAEKEAEIRALGPLNTGEQIGAVISSLFGSLLSPEIAIGPESAGYATASRGGKIARSALVNAGVVGATDRITQDAAVERGDKKEFSPLEWLIATGGAAGLGALIPALGALARRAGALRDAPEAARGAHTEAAPETPRAELRSTRTDEATPVRQQEAPAIEGRGPGYEINRNPDAHQAQGVEQRRVPETIEQPSRPPLSEPASANQETVRPGDAAVAPVPSPTPSRVAERGDATPLLTASPAKAASPDAPRIVSGDGAPAEVGYIASARGLPERFATKTEAERVAAESAPHFAAGDPLRRQIVAAPHPSGDGFAVAVRRAPEGAMPKAKTAELPKGEAAPAARAADSVPARTAEVGTSDPTPARVPEPAAAGQTDAEFLRELEGTLAHVEDIGRRPDLTPADRAEVARQADLMRAGVERFSQHVTDREAQAVTTPGPAVAAREAADQATGARRAAAGLERDAEAEVAAARAEVEQAQVDLRRLKGDPAAVEAPAAAYNEALRRHAPDLSAKEAQLAKLEAALERKRNPVTGEKRAGMERQAERLRETVAAMRRQASPDEARISAARDYDSKVREADARATAANERLRAAEELAAGASARTERRGADEVAKQYRAHDAEEAAGIAPKSDADVPAHMRSDRFPGGSSTLYSNPFGDPRIYRHVAPELVGALTGGFVGEYAETGQVGFSLKWALTGAFAMSGLMRLPIRGRTVLGKDSWAMRGAEKVGDAMAATPILRTLHPRGGVTAELWDKIQRAHVETRNMQADAAARARHIRDRFTADERALMSDWVERQEQARYGMRGFETASAAVRDQAEQLSKHADELGSELVGLKMLDQAAFERLKGQYLHRYYAPHAADDAPSMRTARKQVTATYSRRRGEMRPDVENAGGFKEGDSVLQMVRPDDGETRFVAPAERRRLEAEGFVHGKTWTVETVREGRMDLHRDFSPIERQAMGEVRDAGYRYTRGVIEASRDLALGRLYKHVASNAEWASAAPKDGWHKVADTTVSGSVVKKFGALGGLHVEPRVWSALMAVRKPWTNLENETLNGVMRGYLKALAAWKLGKTAYNPATHFNNFAGNIALSMLSGKIGAGDVARAVGAMRRGDPVLEEARRAGLSLGHEANLGDELGGFAREIGDLTGVEPRHGWLRVLDWFAKRLANNKVTRLYQREDSLFKLASYMAERRSGASPEDAVKEAHKWFFDYRDVPVGVQFMRDAPLPVIGLPFFTYTYKIAQALGRVAIESPHRMLAAYGILSGINMASYGFLYGDKAGAVEAYERELSPEFQKGRNAFGAQRMLRLPWNETDPKTGEKRPAFLNTRYFLPGGDLLDFTGQAKFGPELYPTVFGNTILGGNPLVVALAGAWSGKDTFSGKNIYPYPDTSLFDWQKRPTHEVAANFRALVRWFAFQALPPIMTTVPDKLGNAAVGEGAIDKDSALADFFGWTGTDYAGREKSVAKTLASVFGIKFEDMGLEEQHRFRQMELRRDVLDTLGDARRVHRNETTTEAQRQGQVDAVRARVQRMREESARIDELRRAAGR